jgi:8-oxo-dGTP pyrophosphatase MutT (NUDIX family)
VSRGATITRVTHLDARCEPKHWAWAKENRAAIQARWAEHTRERPRMFNGRVLLMSDIAIENDTCRSTYFETDFADFLAWRDLGYPDRSVTNGFAMGALRGADGAFICGIMGGHTANAGRIYFPAGTPDLSDLQADGTVDLSGSVLRELHEETDLSPDSYQVAEDWIVVRQWPAVAYLRLITFPEPAEAVAERIRNNLARQDDPELAGAKVIAGPQDIDPGKMPASVQSFFHWAFEAQTA